MISKELAQQLKAAGFPSPLTRGTKAIYLPTLSELIGACGERFTLSKGFTTSDSDLDVKVMWSATDRYYRGEGSIPEIAVANLWLALNKK